MSGLFDKTPLQPGCSLVAVPDIGCTSPKPCRFCGHKDHFSMECSEHKSTSPASSKDFILTLFDGCVVGVN